MECFGPTTVCLSVLFICQHEIIAFVYSGYLFFYCCCLFIIFLFCFFKGTRSRKSALDDHEESVIALQPTVLLSSIIWHQAGHQMRDATCECANLKFLMSEWADEEAKDPPPQSVHAIPILVGFSFTSFGRRDKATLAHTYSFTPHHHTN